MFTVKNSIEIPRPVQEVFALAGDYRHDPRWRKGVVSMAHDPPGPPSMQTRTTETMHMLGRRFVTVAEVVAYDVGKHTAFRSLEGPIACEGARLFEPTAAGTRFTYTLTLKPAGLLNLFSIFLRPMFEKQVQDDLKRLKRLACSPDPPPAPV